MNKLHQGFTLIELMVVVAIIAVLASLALPFYTNYIAKSQLSEGYELLAGMKTPLVASIATDILSEQCANTAGWYQSAVRSGKYIARTDISMDAAGTGCLVTAVFKNTTVNQLLKNKKINMRFNVSTSTWECGTDVDTAIRPAACNGDLLQ